MEKKTTLIELSCDEEEEEEEEDMNRRISSRMRKKARYTENAEEEEEESQVEEEDGDRRISSRTRKKARYTENAEEEEEEESQIEEEEEEEDRDRRISSRTRKKARYTENAEEEEELQVEEEEKEEDRDRRISLRKLKRPTYIVDVYDSDEDEEEEEHEDEEDNEQPGPSTQNTHNQRRRSDTLLTVTCGDKRGILDVEKLERGEECVKNKDCWFSPSDFEKFAGKGSYKNWKKSIFHEDKPLQFLFEQGALTTKGYKWRGSKIKKQKKLMSPDHTEGETSESSSEESEIQATEETEEDDVEDEDWLPGSEELLQETEKKGVAVEEIVESESGDDKSQEEEEEINFGNGNFEEREAKLISSIPEKSARLRKVQVVIKRIPEFQAKTNCQSNYMEHSFKDGCREPLDENALNEEETEQNGLTAAHTDPSQMADPAIIKGADEANEFTPSNERKDDGQREIKIEIGNSPTPLPPPATSFQDINPKIEDFGSISNHTASLISSSMLFSVSDVKEAGDCGETIDHRYEDTDATTCSIGAAQLQVKLDTRVPQTTGASTITQSTPPATLSQDIKRETEDTGSTSGHAQSSDTVEPPSSRPSTSCDLDTMDLDQLRREKIKMQIKVLRLQEEYYTRKIKKLD